MVGSDERWLIMRTNGRRTKYGERSASAISTSIRIDFTPAEVEFFKKEARHRMEIHNDSGLRFHQLGIYGEAAAMRALGLPISFCHVHDTGCDFLLGNVEIDVKCSAGEPARTNLLFDSVEQFQADVAILTRLAADEPDGVVVEVIGWTTRKEFRESAKAVLIRGIEKPLFQRELLKPINLLRSELVRITINGEIDNEVTGHADESRSVLPF